MDVALGGAQAFVHSQRPARMSHNVLLRIDIALTWHGDQVALLHLQGLVDQTCNTSPCNVSFCFDTIGMRDVCDGRGAGRLPLHEP